MRKVLLLALLAALPASSRAAEPQRIGAAGGVSGQVKATAPGAAEARVIQSGSPLFLNDRVVTGAKARLQVMLLDETIFTMGPDSDVVLDEFVYDPANDAGKVSVKIAKGAFRFVTGKVSRQEPANMKVKLPVGTIGIRGTMFFVGVTDNNTPSSNAPGVALQTLPTPPVPGGTGAGSGGAVVPAGSGNTLGGNGSAVLGAGTGVPGNLASGGNSNSVLGSIPGGSGAGGSGGFSGGGSGGAGGAGLGSGAGGLGGPGGSGGFAAGSGSVVVGNSRGATSYGGGGFSPGGAGGGAVLPGAGQTVILLGPGAGNNAQETAGAIIVSNGPSSVFIDQPGFGVNFNSGQPALVVSDMSQQVTQLTSELSISEPQPSEQPASGGQQNSGGNQGGSEGGTQAGGGPSLGAGPSVSEQAGQNTAAAGATLAVASELGSLAQTLDQTSNQALLEVLGEQPETQVTFPDGISTWDNVRSVQTGLVNYSASGLCTIVGSAAGDYAVTFNMLVDFGNRRYGGGPSAIQLGPLDSTVIFMTDFAALTGNAVITLAVDQSNIENPSFDGTKVTFNNAGDVPAANATLDLAYFNGIQGSGTAQLTALPGPTIPQ